MKKFVFYATLLLALLTSCSSKTFYQVYEIESQDVSQVENVLRYENSDCRINYNLWSKGGNLSFLIFNKTDKNLFIVMPQSFFILNGIANDYYSESSYSHSVTNSAAMAASRQLSISGFLTNVNMNDWYPARLSRQTEGSIGVSTTETIKTKETAFICVPPKSAKFIRGFNLSDYVYKDCDNYKQNYPKTISSIIRFSQEDTPLSIRNRIAYTFDEQSPNLYYIENQFWLSALKNYSEKSAFYITKEEECESPTKKVQKRFTMSSPNRFYNKYILDASTPKKKTPKKEKTKYVFDEVY